MSKTTREPTGLTDMHGEQIFDGDILSTPGGSVRGTTRGEVMSYGGEWVCYYHLDEEDNPVYDELHDVCGEREVIDNIYDDPELLEVPHV